MESIIQASRRKYHYIYKTTNLINKKFYIGMHSTNNLEDGYVGSGKKLWYSINKYGKENFVTEILEYCESRESLRLREKELVNSELLMDSRCMNLMIGGEGGWDTYNKNSFIQKNKSIKGIKKLKDLWINDKEWSNRTKHNFSKSLKLQYLNKTRIPTGWSSNALLASMTEKTKAKRKQTCLDRKVHQGCNNSQFNKRWVFDETLKISIQVNKDELSTYINNGWKHGKYSIKRDNKILKKQKLIDDKNNKIQLLKQQIIDLNINYNIKGWPLLLASKLNITRNTAKNKIKAYFPDVWATCFLEINKRRN